MKKVKALILLVSLSISLVGCNKSQENEAIVPEVELNMQYSYDEFSEVLNMIANNGLITTDNLSKLDGKVSDSIKYKIENKEINDNTNSEVINTYRAEDTIFIQVKTNNKYDLYKLKVRNNMIVDYVIYQNLN